MEYVPPTKLNAAHKTLVRLGKKLGIEVRFFDSNHNGISEFVMQENRNVVYVRRGGGSQGRTELWSLGHGFIHSLKAQHPDLYAELNKTLVDMIKSEQTAKYSDFLSGDYADIVSSHPDLLLEEILADENGNFFMSDAFWQAIQDQNKPLYEKLVDFVRSMIKHLKKMAGPRVENTFRGGANQCPGEET